jgi:hypothetical protein
MLNISIPIGRMSQRERVVELNPEKIALSFHTPVYNPSLTIILYKIAMTAICTALLKLII